MIYLESRVREVRDYLSDPDSLTEFLSRWENYFFSTEPDYLVSRMEELLIDPTKLSRVLLVVKASVVDPTSKEYLYYVTNLNLPEGPIQSIVVRCMQGCELTCQTGCEHGCETSCVVTCEMQCESTCETSACETGCVGYCQHACQLGCQDACELSCQTGCEVACQTSCETFCESTCQSACQINCQATCEWACQSSCEFACQNDCQNMCQSNCQTACQEACELSGCQTICQVTCEFTCQTPCEAGTCQVVCQSVCQEACQSVCQEACQLACQNACELSCETSGQTQNVTPVMRSNTTPPPYVVASTQDYSSPDPFAYLAFTGGLINNGWQQSLKSNPDIVGKWLSFYFGVSILVEQYMLTVLMYYNGIACAPVDWDLFGSNDGSNYTLLDSRVGESFPDNPTKSSKTFSVANPGYYKYYKLVVHRTQGYAASPNFYTFRVHELRFLKTIV